MRSAIELDLWTTGPSAACSTKTHGMSPAPTPLPLDLRTGPFAAATAHARGLSPTTLEGKRFWSLLHGAYMLADQPLPLPIWVDAARLVLPDDAIVHHLTGLHARGVWVGAPWPLRFASSTDRQVRHRVVRMARLQRLPACDGGVAAAGACFTAACAEFDLVDAVAAGDWLLHLGRCTHDDLRRAVAAHRGTGAPAARRAVRLVRGGAESPRETLVRLMLVLAGLPEPRCNLGVGTAGALIGRGVGGPVRAAYGGAAGRAVPTCRFVVQAAGRRPRPTVCANPSPQESRVTDSRPTPRERAPTTGATTPR